MPFPIRLLVPLPAAVKGEGLWCHRSSPTALNTVIFCGCQFMLWLFYFWSSSLLIHLGKATEHGPNSRPLHLHLGPSWSSWLLVSVAAILGVNHGWKLFLSLSLSLCLCLLSFKICFYLREGERSSVCWFYSSVCWFYSTNIYDSHDRARLKPELHWGLSTWAVLCWFSQVH